MSDLLLRRAGLGDCATLAALGEATFRQTFIDDFAIPYPPEDLAAFLPDAYGHATFARITADPAQAVWLAELQGRPAAYAVAGPASLPDPRVRPEHGELKRLYVAAAHQGAGLGGALFETALAWLEHGGPRPVWIGVWSGNLKAQRFYARYGFHKAGEYDFPVGRWRDRELILRRG